MGYNRFNTGVLIRVLALVVLIISFSFVLANTTWFFTPMVIGALAILSTVELIRYLGKYHRHLDLFLLSLKEGGYSSSFPETKGVNQEIIKSFNEIIGAFQKLALEKESHYQFLQTITENIKVGLICYDDRGHVQWLNPEAKLLIAKSHITSMSDLQASQPDLYNVIHQLQPGVGRLVRILVDGQQTEASIYKKTIVINDQQLHILLLQDIHKEMEYKEVEAWQQLTRVMRHEIMNSLTPIVGLTEAVHQVMTRKNTLSSEEEDFKDILESLDAIENRSRGLIGFVDAYKDFSHTPELHKEDFLIALIFDRVWALLEKQLLEKSISFEKLVRPGDLQLYGDQELIEGVLINLIKNSIEAIQHQEGRIVVSATRTANNKCQIIISDNGGGMNDETLEKIFIPFYTTKGGGSGIGLSLSRQVVQLHGGSIRANSTKSKGSSFVLEL